MKIKQILLVVSLLLSIQLFAQSNTKQYSDYRFNSRFEALFIGGGQIYNDDLLYNPGLGFQFTQSYVLNKNLQVGLGSGYLSMEKIGFYPIYVDMLAYDTSDKKAPLVKMQLGYSFVQDKSTRNLKDYDTDGGVYFSIGLGRAWRINPESSFLINVSYSHQFSQLSYTIYHEKTFKQDSDYAMLVVSASILLH